MADHEPTSKSDAWARIWPVVLILIVTTIAWYSLSQLALHARVKDPSQITKGPITEDYGTAKTWATEILGIATALAGFLGIVATARKGSRLTATERAENAEGAMVGILAGVTLLGVGGWLAPLGLVAAATGTGAALLIRARRAPH